jgi:phosphoribosylamine--glycine ligase
VRLKSDLIPLLEATIDGKLDQVHANWPPTQRFASFCALKVIRALTTKARNSRPAQPQRLDSRLRVPRQHGQENGRWLTSGGRVLGVTARGATLTDAVEEVYRAVGEISWDGMHYRRRHRSRGVTKNLGFRV